MATFNSGVYLKNAVYRPTSVGDDLEIVSSITIPAGTPLAAADVLNFCKIGENVRVQDFVLECDDLDTGAAITFNLGNTNSATAFLSADAVGQAGGERIRRSSDATAGNQFATTPYAVQSSIQSIFATVVAGPAGNPNTDRTISLKLNLFYTLPETELIGLTNVGTGPGQSLQGTKVFAPSVVYTYNGAAP